MTLSVSGMLVGGLVFSVRIRKKLGSRLGPQNPSLELHETVHTVQYCTLAQLYSATCQLNGVETQLVVSLRLTIVPVTCYQK